MPGRRNIAWGLALLAAFMVYGFVLIYLRDFAPGKAQWIADYALGKHFESRLAHVHGALFALINVAVGVVLATRPIEVRQANVISWAALAGMLMPIGILAEVLFGVPPALVLIGGIAMTVAMIWLAWGVWRSG